MTSPRARAWKAASAIGMLAHSFRRTPRDGMPRIARLTRKFLSKLTAAVDELDPPEETPPDTS